MVVRMVVRTPMIGINKVLIRTKKHFHFLFREILCWRKQSGKYLYSIEKRLAWLRRFCLKLSNFALSTVTSIYVINGIFKSLMLKFTIVLRDNCGIEQNYCKRSYDIVITLIFKPQILQYLLELQYRLEIQYIFLNTVLF